MPSNVFTLILSLFIGLPQIIAQGFEGYYQFPDIHQNTIVFTAEGNLWKVSVEGGLAQRLTTHAEEERYPAISPDGKMVAYSASYEGPTEVYTMPIDGGMPTRWTYESEPSIVNSWAADGKIVYQTHAFNKLPDQQLVSIDLQTKTKSIVPLHQASEGEQHTDGRWLFVRPSDHGDNTKRYIGGWARQIWSFDGKNEALKLSTDHKGESCHPMWYDRRRSPGGATRTGLSGQVI